jgi:DNA uptake protein ComE-like DNA-binding protein
MGRIGVFLRLLVFATAGVATCATLVLGFSWSKKDVVEPSRPTLGTPQQIEPAVRAVGNFPVVAGSGEKTRPRSNLHLDRDQAALPEPPQVPGRQSVTAIKPSNTQATDAPSAARQPSPPDAVTARLNLNTASPGEPIFNSTSARRYDLNTASLEELNALRGGGRIGRAIVNGRPYTSPEQLIQKRVLSRATFDRIKEQITVD